MKYRFCGYVVPLICSFFISNSLKSVQELAVIQKVESRSDILKKCHQERLSVKNVVAFLQHIEATQVFPGVNEGMYRLHFTRAICVDDKRLIDIMYKIRQKIGIMAAIDQQKLQALLCEVGEPLPPLDCDLVDNPLTLEDAVKKLPSKLQGKCFSWNEFSEGCQKFFYCIRDYNTATTCEKIYLKQTVVNSWYFLNRIIRAFAAEEGEEPEINTYFRSLPLEPSRENSTGIVKGPVDTLLMFAISLEKSVEPTSGFISEGRLANDLVK